ncbi:MAG TPA: MbnH family di-heme enzyme [Polyangiaceae bacterium]|nr:MbnH family di-heme enzyme [Polyangiaceae bacterium]
MSTPSPGRDALEAAGAPPRSLPGRLAALAALATAALPLAFGACGGSGDDDNYDVTGAASYAWQLPAGFPEPAVPADNPMSVEKVELGRRLFYDQRMSANGTMACASCHDQARAFSDGRALPEGSTGQILPRNAMGLANVAYSVTYTWANPTLDTLEKQALVPLFGEAPVELGWTGRENEILARLRDDETLRGGFERAFAGEGDPVTTANVAKALASFERTLVSGGSAYDRYAYGGEPGALSESAARGLDLFFSEKLECYHCHGGITFSESFRSKDTRVRETGFHNTGLYNVDGSGAYPADNPGLKEFTNDPRDMGKFRVPSLRNVALTAPYMHDGSIATLAEVLDHYAAGGRNVEAGPRAGDGRASPVKDALVRAFPLSEQERADVIAFLESLTDEAFTRDPRFAPPADAP